MCLFFFVLFFSDFLYESICCGYSFELHQEVDAIQMGTHNICLYKEVDKKYSMYLPKVLGHALCLFLGKQDYYFFLFIYENTWGLMRNKNVLKPSKCLDEK